MKKQQKALILKLLKLKPKTKKKKTIAKKKNDDVYEGGNFIPKSELQTRPLFYKETKFSYDSNFF